MQFSKILLSTVFPQKCAGCGKASGGETVCAGCFSSLPIQSALFCGRCDARYPAGKRTCHKSFPYAWGAAADYDNPVVKNLIHLLKFKFVPKAAKPLGELLVKYVSALPLDLKSFTVVPVPLSQKRLRERGFNQSELISKVLSERLGLPLETKLLSRSKYSKPQSEASGRTERLENVRGCFSMSGLEPLPTKNILLIDDVTTSGATFFEAATTLKKGGARTIFALAAARA